MSKISRTENALKNVRITMICQIVKILSGFASRTVFTWLLGVQYLGMQGLFSNILSLLSFVELGMGSAVVFNLYEPLKNGDKERICQYLQFYKKLYRFVIFVIAVIGISLVPFLDKLIQAPDIKENITVIYLLFLLQTCLSYAFVYKKNLLIADQKTYLIAIYQQASSIAANIIQIVILCLFTNYYLFLILGLTAQLLENYFCVCKANELYPYIKEKATDKLPNKAIHDFKRNVKGLLVNKIAGVTFDSTDNIFISVFVGISSVGILSNYLLIVIAINGFLNQVIGAVGATIGNLVLDNDREYEHQMFQNIYFVNALIYGALTCFLTSALGPFITEIWLSHEFYLPLYVVWLIVLEWCLRGLHYPVYMFRSAHGFFYQLKWIPFFAAIGNLIMDYFFVQIWGVAGIYMATILARMTVRLADVYVLYNKAFKKRISKFYLKHFSNLLIIIFSIFISEYICNGIRFAEFNTVIKTSMSFGIYLTILLINCYGTNEYVFLKKLVVYKVLGRIKELI